MTFESVVSAHDLYSVIQSLILYSSQLVVDEVIAHPVWTPMAMLFLVVAVISAVAAVALGARGKA